MFKSTNFIMLECDLRVNSTHWTLCHFSIQHGYIQHVNNNFHLCKFMLLSKKKKTHKKKLAHKYEKNYYRYLMNSQISWQSYPNIQERNVFRKCPLKALTKFDKIKKWVVEGIQPFECWCNTILSFCDLGIHLYFAIFYLFVCCCFLKFLLNAGKMFTLHNWDSNSILNKLNLKPQTSWNSSEVENTLIFKE